MMQHTSVWYRRSVSPFVLVASVAVFLTATANLTFFDKISQTYPIADNLGFVLTIAVVLFGAMLLITTLLSSYRYVLKPVLILLLIMGADEYDVDTAKYQENVLDTLDRLGVSILWRDNNSDSKGVMDKLPKAQFADYKSATNNAICNTNPYNECRDVGMLVGLDDFVAANNGKDMLIMLHQMGNHGPAYFKRYDEKFAKFTPVCEGNELAKCEHQSLINAYDNALLATDDFIAQSIQWLQTHSNAYDVSMLYVSDHGESLGENGVYLHGMPNAFAPKEQRSVPAFFWTDKQTGITPMATDTVLTHDAITPTLLKLFDVTADKVKDRTAFIR